MAIHRSCMENEEPWLPNHLNNEHTESGKLFCVHNIQGNNCSMLCRFSAEWHACQKHTEPLRRGSRHEFGATAIVNQN
jgi:hypothetical protein